MRFVTSFGPSGYSQYGHRFLDTWAEHGGGEMVVYTEEATAERFPNVEFRDLFAVQGIEDFLSITGRVPSMQGRMLGMPGRNYRFDIHKFCRKSFAQWDAARDYDGRLVWLDADVEIRGPIVLPDHQGEFMQFLGREGGHSCASYVSWDCGHDQSAAFWDTYYALHMSGAVFTLPEWHDSFVLDVLREQMGLSARNIAPPVKWPGNVFDEAFPWGHHKKGALKKGPQRYGQLIEIVKQLQPQKVVEVGTWNGGRALEMAAAAPGLEYHGFDLFEDATPETDAVEKNVKPHHSVEDVARRLEGIQAHLYRGNTRETMAAVELSDVDLAYIDGGHAVETVRSDWENVRRWMKPGGVVVFDDVYEGDIDTDQFGANVVLRDVPHDLLPIADPVVGGGQVKMAVVRV